MTSSRSEELVSGSSLKSSVCAGNLSNDRIEPVIQEASLESDALPQAEASLNPSQRSSSKLIQPVIHFSTLSADYHAPSPTKPESAEITGSSRATLQLVERDEGSHTDFYSIYLNIVIRLRPHGSEVMFPIDDVLTLRHLPTPLPASVRLHARGAVPLGTLAFPNGPDACLAFILALRNHAIFRNLPDSLIAGTLYVLEPKPRMRRMAPSLMPLWYPQPSSASVGATTSARLDDDGNERDNDTFNTLLSDLNISSATSSHPSKPSNRDPRPLPAGHNVTMTVLSQFARITQMARDVGDQLVNMVDEERRRATTERERQAQAARNAALDIHATIVASSSDERNLPPRLELDETRGVSVDRSAWQAALEENGRLLDVRVFRYAIFAGGLHASLRQTIWPFLLGFYPWSSSSKERETILQKARTEYAVLKRRLQRAWEKSSVDAPEQQSSVESSEKRNEPATDGSAMIIRVRDQIAKDVVRTDRSLDMFRNDDAPALDLMGTLLNVYAFYNPDILYCQGMSDFLAPILYVIGLDDEAVLFWCFEKLMRRMEANFRIDQSGMHLQLAMLKKVVRVADDELATFFEETDPQYYACFRWIVVRFKRELSFEDVTRLWEILWTKEVGGDDLHIYVAAGLLIAHRKQLLALRRGAFDCLLRYINDLSMRINVDFAIHQGELCYRKYAEAVLS